jgi:hypothetical protein
MAKYKFSEEYSFKASAKVLFTYISSAGGLQQWFAKKVSMDSNHDFHFTWDNETHIAKLSSVRLNKSTRFDFINEDEGNYLEFKLNTSELDNSTFLRVTDYSDNENQEDLEELWSSMIDDLKEIVGG